MGQGMTTALEQEDINDLMESFQELAQESELYLEKINCDNSDLEDLNGLFRAIHTIKGNAAMFGARVIVDYTHSLEEVVDAIRGEQLSTTSMVCESLLLGLDRLKDLHEREFYGQTHENLHERELEHLFAELSEAKENTITHICHEIMELLGAGFVLNDASLQEAESVLADVNENITCEPKPEGKSKSNFDLDFFKEIGHQVDKQSQYWTSRSDSLLRWALKMNQFSAEPIDEQQLTAAVYMHDVGMSYISAQTLDKREALTEEERQEIKQHPLWSYNYLIRIQGWHEAATIVLEHHERIDGQGYPLGIKGNLIHRGAKILSIIDAYFSITHGRADRAHRKSIVRAICEINARKGTQFDGKWVNIFNDIIKSELKELN